MSSKTWDDVEEIIARAIYEKWPTTFVRRAPNTESFESYRLEPVTDTWEEMCSDDPTRAEECRDAARKIGRALIAAGLAIVPREATEAMIKANMEPRGSVYPCPSNHTALIREWNAALSAGELAPPDKGEG